MSCREPMLRYSITRDWNEQEHLISPEAVMVNTCFIPMNGNHHHNKCVALLQLKSMNWPKIKIDDDDDDQNASHVLVDQRLHVSSPNYSSECNRQTVQSYTAHECLLIQAFKLIQQWWQVNQMWSRPPSPSPFFFRENLKVMYATKLLRTNEVCGSMTKWKD